MAAYGGPQFQVTQQVMNRFAEAVQQSRVDVVPRVVVSGGGGENGATGSSIMEGLLTLLLSDKLGLEVNGETPRAQPGSRTAARRNPPEHDGEERRQAPDASNGTGRPGEKIAFLSP